MDSQDNLWLARKRGLELRTVELEEGHHSLGDEGRLPILGGV